MFQCSKNINNVFGTCVYFCKKSWTYVRKIFFLNWTENSLISLHCSYLFITTLYPFYSLSRKPNPCTPHLHRCLKTSTAELHGRWISSPPLAFEDPARDRAFVAADPSLQDPSSNLTFTFFVNGFWSKEWRVPQTEKFVFWFLFFCFVFPHQSGKPIFPVLCLLLRWSFDLQSKHTHPTF